MQGTFTFFDPETGAVTDKHQCKLEIGHKDNLYSQRNTYTWEDGRQEVHDFPGEFKDGKVLIDAKDLIGYAEELSDDTVLFYATYKPESHRAGVDVWDLIRLTGESQRYRTWQIKAGPKVVTLVQVNERPNRSPKL